MGYMPLVTDLLGAGLNTSEPEPPTSKNVILHHDNARLHTAYATIAAIRAKGWNILPRPPYSPDLAPPDFYLFGPLRTT